MYGEGRDPLHAVPYVLKGEEGLRVSLTPSLHHQSTEVFQKDRRQCLCRMRHQNGTSITTLFRQIGKGPAVVQMKVGNNYAINDISQSGR